MGRFRQGGHWQQTLVTHVGLCGTSVELDIFMREGELAELVDLPSQTEVFPLCRYNFHGLLLPGPGQAEAFLARVYGADFASTVRVWSHGFNAQLSLTHDPGKVRVPLADYQRSVKAWGYEPPSLCELAGCDVESGAAEAAGQGYPEEAYLAPLFEPGQAAER